MPLKKKGVGRQKIAGGRKQKTGGKKTKKYNKAGGDNAT